MEEDPTTPETAANEPVFVDTIPEKEPKTEDKPKKVLPKQYNEKELRRFNRQVSSRNATDDDDDTI